MIRDSFYNYRNYRWLWLTAGILLLMTGFFVFDRPLGGRNGGTFLGYTYGILAAVCIVWLTYYGARKRSYASRIGTLQGWLSAHVWLGIGLVFAVPLHAAFQFGWNVHTLAYALMVLTIASGIWGAINYATLADSIESHRGGGSQTALLEELQSLDSEIEKVLATRSDLFVSGMKKLDLTFRPSLWLLLGTGTADPIDRKRASELIATLPAEEEDAALRVVELIDQKIDTVRQITREARTKTLLKLWLFFHVPLAFALLAALAVHIVSVLYFRW